jgi:hypothetical protein
MSEPVRLYNAAGEWFDCVAPSEVVRLLDAGDWRREPWAEPAPAVLPDDDGIPFATPLPKRRLQRKPSRAAGVL